MFLNWYKSYGSSCKMSTFDKYMYIYDSKCDVYTASQHEIWLSSMSKFINVRILKKESLPWGQCLRLIFQNLSMLMNLKICLYTIHDMLLHFVKNKIFPYIDNDWTSFF